MSQKMPRPRGRPRSFDEREALQKAIRVFWAKGYDAVTIDDLVAGMGVVRPSLYAIFGDNGTLFIRRGDASAYQCRSRCVGRGTAEQRKGRGGPGARAQERARARQENAPHAGRAPVRDKEPIMNSRDAISASSRGDSPRSRREL